MNEGGGDEWRWMNLWIWISLTKDKYWKCFLSISLLYFCYWYPFAFLIITIIIIVRPLRDCRVVLLGFFTSLNLVNPHWSSAGTNIQSNIRWLSPRLVRGTRSSRKYILLIERAISPFQSDQHRGRIRPTVIIISRRHCRRPEKLPFRLSQRAERDRRDVRFCSKGVLISLFYNLDNPVDLRIGRSIERQNLLKSCAHEIEKISSRYPE